MKAANTTTKRAHRTITQQQARDLLEAAVAVVLDHGIRCKGESVQTCDRHEKLEAAIKAIKGERM